MKLEDVIDIKGSGKTNSGTISNSGEYPFYSASVKNPSGTHNKYDFDGDKYILLIKSGGNKENPISRSHGIGKVYLVKGKCAANVAVFLLQQK